MTDVIEACDRCGEERPTRDYGPDGRLCLPCGQALHAVRVTRYYAVADRGD